MRMKPVVPTAKRSTGFSIDSIIGTSTKTSTHKPSTPTTSGTAPLPRPAHTQRMDVGVIPRVPPPHPGLHFNFKGSFPEAVMNHELLALRSAWGLMTPHVDSLQHLTHGHLLSNALPLNHPLLNGHSRESGMNLYPLLMGRQNHCINYPFPGSHDPGLMFHPYRKPKRIRTAFSPSQLLKLEDAFEKNHYVVGQERKDLASKLSLSETQVKVWFQNRRTKSKRVKSDDDDDAPSNQSAIQEHYDKSDDENDIEEVTLPAENVTHEDSDVNHEVDVTL